MSIETGGTISVMDSKERMLRPLRSTKESSSGIPSQSQGNEVVERSFLITFESPETKQSTTLDFFKADWEEFGTRINLSVGNTNFEEGILRGAIKQGSRSDEDHEKTFLDWLNQRMDIMIQEAIVKTDSGYQISPEFIDKSTNRSMGYQLAFMFRHARPLFSDENVTVIRNKVIEMLNSNDVLTVQETLREFGDLDELLPPDRHVSIKSDDYLVKQIVRGMPQRKPGTKYTAEQIQKAYDLVRGAIADRFRKQIDVVR